MALNLYTYLHLKDDGILDPVDFFPMASPNVPVRNAALRNMHKRRRNFWKQRQAGKVIAKPNK